MQAHATEYTSFDPLQAPATRNKGQELDGGARWASGELGPASSGGPGREKYSILTDCIVTISLLSLPKHVQARRVMAIVISFLFLAPGSPSGAQAQLEATGWCEQTQEGAFSLSARARIHTQEGGEGAAALSSSWDKGRSCCFAGCTVTRTADGL